MKNLYKYVIIGFLAVSPLSAFATHSVAHIDERIAQIKAEIDELTLQIQILRGQTSSVSVASPTPILQSSKFKLNDRIQVLSGSLYVRETPSFDGRKLGIQPTPSKGTVVGGPIFADGYNWWNINYDNDPDGWSAENWLIPAPITTTTTVVPPQPTTATPSGTSTTQSVVTFSHDGKILIAGQDTWTFTLSNARAGDILSVRAYKKGIDQGVVEICKSFLASCVKQGTPSLSDVGIWEEVILINGVATGQEISFEVKAPTAPTPSPTPAITGTSFNFSHNNKTLTAGKDTWVLNVSGLKGGDSVYVDAWKDEIALGKFKICDVANITSPIPATSCGGNGSPTNADQGSWKEAIVVRRNGVDTTIAPKGAIKFSVVTVAQPTTTYSSPSSATYTFSANGKTLIAGQNPWTFNLQNGRVGDKLTVVILRGGDFVAEGKQFEICTVLSGQTSCAQTATPTSADLGQWIEIVYINGREKGEVSFRVDAPPTTTTTMTAARPVITVTAPASGEQIEAGKTYTVRWTSSNMPADAKIGIDILKSGDAGSYVTLVSTNTANDGFETITIPSTIGSNYIIVVNCSSSTVQCSNADSGLFTIIAPTTTTTTTTTTVAQPTVTFSHDGKILIAGQDTWTFTLSNARAGDILSVRAYKKGIDQGVVEICKSFLASCVKQGTPSLSDVGIWEEVILINGVATGQEISFEVKAPVTTTTTTVVQPTVTYSAPLTSFTFSHTGGTLVAGRDAWTFSLINANIGDKLEVLASKGDSSPVRYDICTVQSASSCSLSATPGVGDIGNWRETVLINGVEKGVIEFKVVAYTSSVRGSNFAGVVYAMMETLNSISKQLDLLK